MLDLVPRDIDELRLKPVQSRRLMRAIEEMIFDESRQVYSDPIPDRSQVDTPQRRSGLSATAQNSIGAAVEALRRAQTAREERAMTNDISSTPTMWDQSPSQALPMSASKHMNRVAVAWDCIADAPKDPNICHRRPSVCEIGVVDRLFCEVKPLLTQQAMRNNGPEHGDGAAPEERPSPPTVPQAVNKRNHVKSSTHNSLPSHLGSPFAATPAEDQDVRTESLRHLTPLVTSVSIEDPDLRAGRLRNATGTARLGSLSSTKRPDQRQFVVGPGIHSRNGIDDCVLAALASVSSRPLSSHGGATPSPLQHLGYSSHSVGDARSIGTPSTPSSISDRLSRRSSPEDCSDHYVAGTTNGYGVIATPTMGALERLLNTSV